MSSHREIEIKLEVAPDVAVPELSDLPGVATVESLAAFDLEAAYLDTADLRLLAARITLRRRTGGADAGWHLKLPVAADERIELRVPLDPAEGAVPGEVAADLPAELMAATRARVRELPLAPVAVLHTRRTVRNLRGAGGQILAEMADDVVTSRAPGDGEVYLDSWREWEVELVDGDRGLLTAARERLQAAGGVTPATSSKLARALRPRLVIATGGAPSATGDTGSAGAVLGEYLRSRREEVLGQDPLVRRDAPDAVHQMRIATRRVRSALATYRPLLVRERSEAVRVELGWLAALLGAARDAEVGRARLAELIAQEPPELVAGPVAERLDAERAGAYDAAHAAVLKALDSARYFQLLDDLDALVDDLPVTKIARNRAAKTLPALVRRDWERLERAYRAATHAPAGPRREALLHEARKAAKRARYAGEVVTPAVGRPAQRSARAAKKLADLLGLHHDSVELRAVLLRAGLRAHLEGENSFAYGRLHALEQVHAERIEDQLPALWDRVSAARRRRWMR